MRMEMLLLLEVVHVVLMILMLLLLHMLLVLLMMLLMLVRVLKVTLPVDVSRFARHEVAAGLGCLHYGVLLVRLLLLLVLMVYVDAAHLQSQVGRGSGSRQVVMLLVRCYRRCRSSGRGGSGGGRAVVGLQLVVMILMLVLRMLGRVVSPVRCCHAGRRGGRRRRIGRVN